MASIKTNSIQRNIPVIRDYDVKVGDDTILTGLGGSENKLRYEVVVSPMRRKTLTTVNKQVIRSKLDKVAKEYDCEVEEIKFNDNYVSFMILVPIDVAAQTPIDKFLDIVSTKEKILRYHFLIVNTHKLTDKEIEEYLDEVKDL